MNTDYKPSSDIPLPTDNIELTAFAKAWIDTAAQHLRNEEYWRERCKTAEIELGKGDLWKEYPPNDKPAIIPLTILLNGKETVIETENITYEQVVKLVFGVEAYPRPTVQYTRGSSDKPSGVLLPGQAVTLKDGMVFDVAFTGFA